MTQEIRAKLPRSLAMGGSAVATTVWSSAERKRVSIAPMTMRRISDGVRGVVWGCSRGIATGVARRLRQDQCLMVHSTRLFSLNAIQTGFCRSFIALQHDVRIGVSRRKRPISGRLRRMDRQITARYNSLSAGDN